MARQHQINREIEKVMSKEEWLYAWVREAVHAGLSVESANRGFKEWVGLVNDVDLNKDPAAELDLFMQQSTLVSG